jgi:hypothetical protein
MGKLREEDGEGHTHYVRIAKGKRVWEVSIVKFRSQKVEEKVTENIN